ncbi:hypothetical protein I4U23_002440 [Adineta vaga]|nr:hypothetical protein I4U23_002440 [Adineta vaga]
MQIHSVKIHHSIDDIIHFSTLFSDHLTIDKLNRSQLVSLCKLLRLPYFGPDSYLRMKLHLKFRQLKSDDRLIINEGIQILSIEELQIACHERNICSMNIGMECLRLQLQQWLDLHLNKCIPTSILIFSHVYRLHKINEEQEIKKQVINIEPAYLHIDNDDIKDVSKDCYMVHFIGSFNYNCSESDRFLFPIVGTHLNLRVESLVGWKQCFHGKYNIPFDSKVLTNVCKGKRLLVACRSTNDTKTLVVAGMSKREHTFSPCTTYEYCATEKKNGISFYYVHNHVWGFKGSPDDPIEMDTEDDGHGHGHDNHQQEYDEVVDLDTCDQSDLNSEYRLCWSLRSNIRRRVGDRCGSLKNLHNTEGWERLIYHID